MYNYIKIPSIVNSAEVLFSPATFSALQVTNTGVSFVDTSLISSFATVSVYVVAYFGPSTTGVSSMNQVTEGVGIPVTVHSKVAV